ncbi:MAG: hypothetical protein HC788_04400 [Sphingopyxis sp.]|nr:hypothetical protein [Sphingopyxis sp.]
MLALLLTLSAEALAEASIRLKPEGFLLTEYSKPNVRLLRFAFETGRSAPPPQQTRRTVT